MSTVYITCVQDVKDGVVSAVTNVTLWYSDPGYLGNMQYWSENHQSEISASKNHLGKTVE